MQTTTRQHLAGKLFARFSDPSRLAILHCLRDGARSVGDISAATGLSQSNTSNHLHCLHCCGLIRRQQAGRRVFYELADPLIAEFLDLAEVLLTGVATGVASCTRYGRPSDG